MATVNEKMGALANEIRELSGTTSIKTIDNMTNDVAQANEEILDQAELINQIYSALENKAGSSGVQLPTLTTPASASDILSGKEAIDGSGNKITGTIATKTASNLTASGATVTVPAGYYASQATKSVATATQATPSVSISSAGKITASATQTAGYVSAGTKTGTKQLTTQAAKTVTPTTSSQTAVASGVYTTGAITVGPIPSNYEDVGTETNTYTDLNDELEAVINSLPSGGGSGVSVGTCVVTVNNFRGIIMHYTDKDMMHQATSDLVGDYVIAKNTIIFFNMRDWDVVASCGGGVQNIINTGAYIASDDGFITIAAADEPT